MRRRILFIAGIMLLSFSSPRAVDLDGDEESQVPNCGSVQGNTVIYQNGTGAANIAGFSQTTRQWTGCGSRIRVEAWIDGLPAGTLVDNESVRGGIFTAIQWVFVPVDHYGKYGAQGKHFYVNFGSRMLVYLSHGETTLTQSPDNPDDAPPVLAPENPDCPNCADPILVNPQGDGLHLTSAENGVLFDIDADGTLDRVPWTEPGSDDAWLAMDRNGNGIIDNGSELFGNRTPAFAGQSEPVARNGFQALDFLHGLDYGHNVDDGVLDARDEVFRRLLVWRDANHDGISQPDELQTASQAGLVAIEVVAKESRRRDSNGNLFSQRAKAEWVVGNHAVSSYAFDVWLRVKR
jgi:hypothetical protein